MIRLQSGPGNRLAGTCSRCGTAVVPGFAGKFLRLIPCPYCDLGMSPRIKQSRVCQCAYPDCQHRWIKRHKRLPLKCPMCKRRHWDTGGQTHDPVPVSYPAPSGQVASEPMTLAASLGERMKNPPIARRVRTMVSPLFSSS